MKDDLISRAEAIEKIENLWNSIRRFHPLLDDTLALYADIKRIVKQLPSAQRTGKWIDMDEQSYTWKVRCSVCGHERSMMSTQGEYPNYCENCGARMVEDDFEH